MLKLFALVLFSIIASFSVSASAPGGEYICGDTSSDYDYLISSTVAKMLNQMKCDTTKPVTVTPYGQGGIKLLVCCVQK